MYMFNIFKVTGISLWYDILPGPLQCSINKRGVRLVLPCCKVVTWLNMADDLHRWLQMCFAPFSPSSHRHLRILHKI